MKQKLALLIVIAMIVSLFSGCSSKEEANMKGANTEENNQTATSDKEEKQEDEKSFSYPMENVELTIWAQLDSTIAQNYSNLSDTPFGQQLQKETGVDIEYIHPVQGQHVEQFNLMTVSGDLPDIIEYNVLNEYVGGPEKAIADEVILDLTDLIPKYAPNLHKFYQENPEIAKMARTDTGKYYSFPFIRGDESLNVYFGPVVNKVWLEELGLDYPETMDDWYEMLTLFKEEKGATAPLTYQSWMLSTPNGSPFVGAYGIARDFYLDDNGDVQFGSMQPEFKDFLSTFALWYKEGLIDADIETVDKAQVAAKLANGEAGASIGYGSSRLGSWIKATENNPEIDFTGVKYPVLNEGELPKFTQKSFPLTGQDAFITTACKDVEAALRFLDYGYSEEGMKLFNYGIEGETYTMVDNYPTYTDFVLNNPEKSSAEVLKVYTRAPYNGSMVQTKEYGEQYNYTYEQQEEAIKNWSVSDADKHRIPLITPTPEESEELAMIMGEINTYRDEMQVRYILGAESLDSYDDYVENIKNMGIDRAIEIYESALERYNNR